MTGWERGRSAGRMSSEGQAVSVTDKRLSVFGSSEMEVRVSETCLRATGANGWSYPGQGQDAADVLGDDQRGLGARHGHVEQVQLVLWDFTCGAEITAECNLRAGILLGTDWVPFIYQSLEESPPTDLG